MLAAGAPDGHCQIAALVVLERRQPVGNEGVDLRHHLVHFGLRAQVFGHRGVAPAHRPQLANVVRVGQDAHVEDEVGVERDAVFERKALEHQRQPARVGAHQVAHPDTQLRRAQLTRVEHGGRFAHFSEQLALELDCVDQGAPAIGRLVFLAPARRAVVSLVRQGVRAPGLGKAAHQRVGARIEEQRTDRHTLVAQLRHQGQEVRQGSRAARVHSDGDAALRALVLEPQELAQQFGRQVVDAEKPRILQRMQRHRLA